jgi:antitoxin component of RelBE/YafQ-DinJ toxin-antitoxin module
MDNINNPENEVQEELQSVLEDLGMTEEEFMAEMEIALEESRRGEGYSVEEVVAYIEEEHLKNVENELEIQEEMQAFFRENEIDEEEFWADMFNRLDDMRKGNYITLEELHEQLEEQFALWEKEDSMNNINNPENEVQEELQSVLEELGMTKSEFLKFMDEAHQQIKSGKCYTPEELEQYFEEEHRRWDNEDFSNLQLRKSA